MQKIDFNISWGFKPLRIGESEIHKQDRTDIVNLPHDFSIVQKMDHTSASGPNTGFYTGGTAEYEKKFELDKSWVGKTVIIEFEGVYMNSTVWINDQIVAKNPYGYTSFLCDITEHLKPDGENILKVSANNNADPNSRWYSGSGIYRHVWVHVGDKVHLGPRAIFVTTPQVSADNAIVKVEVDIDLPDGYTLKNSIFDTDGREVSQEAQSAVKPLEQKLSVEKPKLWSTDTPNLYKLKTEILNVGRVVDSVVTTFGIRQISFDFNEGFKLNGIPMKMKGGCVHHDCGILGSAAYPRAEERKVELLKASGFNAVRCAHNPPSPAFLDACDRLGMLVIDEAFDCWREGKTPYDYNLYFEAFWKTDMKSMIFRDRNHPSIIMWSTGNEIIERSGRSDGYKISRELADYARELDSTRPITNAICAIWEIEGESDKFEQLGRLTEKFSEPLDVVGYNYQLERYESDAKTFPGRIIVGSETFPLLAFDYWEGTMNNNHVIGDFVWTSWDYLGEAGIGHVWYNGEKTFMGVYPWNQAFCGDIDVCGFKRPQSYYRDTLWNSPTAPYIAVHKPEFYGKTPDISPWAWHDVVNSWSWPGFEGKPVKIDVYSVADEVELFQDGVSLGRKVAGKSEKYISSFETKYSCGSLRAVGYSGGEILGESTITTPGAAEVLLLVPDRCEISREYGDLSFVKVEMHDSNQNLVSHSSEEITFEVEGPGTLVAVGSSNPISSEGYCGNKRSLCNGRAMAVVRSEGTPGEIKLRATAKNGVKGECIISLEG